VEGRFGEFAPGRPPAPERAELERRVVALEEPDRLAFARYSALSLERAALAAAPPETGEDT
jgi:hypothetical protein